VAPGAPRRLFQDQEEDVNHRNLPRQLRFDAAALHVLQTRLQRSLFEEEGSLLEPNNE